MFEKIILASNSPRRIDLLKSCDIKFEVRPHNFDESSLCIKDPVKLAEILAIKKADSLGLIPEFYNKYILGVDTIVVINKKILGKPENKIEAEKFIRMLSGKSNIVISGIAIFNKEKNLILSSRSISKVTFKRFSDSFIEFYLDNNHWEGYAGGYAIQGIFSLVIKKIVGSYTNIVGLPMEILYDMLIKLKLFP